MKTSPIFKIAKVILALVIALSVFNWIKTSAIKKVTKQKTELELKYKALQQEKFSIDMILAVKKKQYVLLQSQKDSLTAQLLAYTAKTDKIIEEYKKTIADIKNIPADTIYKYVYDYFNALNNETPIYPFTENQIRGIHENIYENMYLKDRLTITDKSLYTCRELNKGNDNLIINLTEQNKDLYNKNQLSESQIENLNDQLKLSEKTAGKNKRKAWIYRTTTFIMAGGCVYFAIN